MQKATMNSKDLGEINCNAIREPVSITFKLQQNDCFKTHNPIPKELRCFVKCENKRVTFYSQQNI